MLKEKERYVLEEKHKIASWVTEVGRKMPKMIPRFLFWGTEHGILKYIWHKTIYHLRYTLHYMCVLRCSVVSDSLWPQGLQSAKLLCPWNSLGKDTGVGFHFLPWGIFPTQGLNQRFLHGQVDSFHCAPRKSIYIYTHTHTHTHTCAYVYNIYIHVLYILKYIYKTR